ncbi:hypothetical protein PR202_ga22640 [Eleusine coracana subsp. coracana]|uniref:CASP-like protein n=1 Tax=Eleusine coracana subsp. coracana TaxID=191504 RepID=A0AAV5D374_ELECO|nr:hypothetical protein PR202_ga22640 [Eleusine coracana subsp. coracana]
MTHEKKKSELSKCAYAVIVAGSLAVIGLAVASAALMASARECTIYAAFGARPYIVSYSQFSPFVYLVVANAIAASLEAIAVFLIAWKKGEDKIGRKVMPFIGAAVPALLYSSTGAAFAAGADMSYCSAYGGGKRVSICSSDAGRAFCGQVHLAVNLSLGAAAAVTFVQVVTSLALSKTGSGDGCDSDSDSDFCGHGCHSKH